jgi:hypothetical protein
LWFSPDFGNEFKCGTKPVSVLTPKSGLHTREDLARSNNNGFLLAICQAFTSREGRLWTVAGTATELTRASLCKSGTFTSQIALLVIETPRWYPSALRAIFHFMA